MMKPDSPAYPIPSSTLQVYAYGLTKREYFAAIALQGLLANGAHRIQAEDFPERSFQEERFARIAVETADALIAELNKS